ncbi:MAG: ATP-dependent helicase [Pseudomonadota bacterium]
MSAVIDFPAKVFGNLNPEQLQAAQHGSQSPDGRFVSGPLLVIAGAGTGKTTTLAHRVAHLILRDVPPAEILLLTFTRRAADEMIRRAQSIVRKTLAEKGEKQAVRFPWAGTFHSVANRLLRRYSANVGLDPAFSVLDRGDAADLLDLLRHELKLSAKNRRFPKKDTCLQIYSRRVNSQQPLQQCLQESFPWCQDWDAELTVLFRTYVERKQEHMLLDYDDLLLYWFHLSANKSLAAEIGAGFQHVLIDEYQDTNALQAGILMALKPDGQGVSVVGDDAQSIYSFRAAHVENILRFPDQFMPSARVVSLERNYRSVMPVLESANTLINASGVQYKKNLYSEKHSQQKPYYVSVEDSDAEADYIVNRVLANREAGASLMDQAVLFRNSHHSDILELELLRRDIPYVKYGGLKFLEAAHVKDLLSVLKWADNPHNQIAAFRVLKLLPGMGPAHAGRCFEHVAANDFRLDCLAAFKPPAASVDDWLAFAEVMATLAANNDSENPAWQSDIAKARAWYKPYLEQMYEAPEQRNADLEQLQQVSAKYASRERFLTELTLDPPQSSSDLAGDPLVDEDYLILSTVHSAKGQEWESVFLMNVTDGNFPSEFACGKAEQIDEERRLMYVAMTRAKNDLHLMVPLKFSVTQQHRHGDRHVYGARSRFVTEQLLATFETCFHASPLHGSSGGSQRSSEKVDVAASLRSMW